MNYGNWCARNLSFLQVYFSSKFPNCCDTIVEILAWYVIFRIIFKLRMNLVMDIFGPTYAIMYIDALNVVLY